MISKTLLYSLDSLVNLLVDEGLKLIADRGTNRRNMIATDDFLILLSQMLKEKSGKETRKIPKFQIISKPKFKPKAKTPVKIAKSTKTAIKPVKTSKTTKTVKTVKVAKPKIARRKR